MSNVAVAAPAAVVATPAVVTPVVDTAGATPPASGSGAAATPSAEPAWLSEKVELMVNGKKKTVTVKEARDLAQKADAADEKFRAADARAKQIEEVVAKVTNVGELENVLRTLGANPDEIIDALAEKRAQARKQAEDESKLTPEQRELLQYRREKAEREANAKAEAEKKAAREAQVKHETTVTMVAGKIEEALKALNLPKTDENLAVVTRALKDLNAEEGAVVSGKFKLSKLLEKIVARGNNHFKWTTQNYQPERVHQVLGDEAAEAYLKWYLANKSGRKSEKEAKNPVARATQKRNLII